MAIPKKAFLSLKHLQLCSLNDESAIKKVIYTIFLLSFPFAFILPNITGNMFV